MDLNIGIWIDLKKAMLVSITGDASSLNVLYSQIEKRERIEGESSDSGRFGAQVLDHAKTKDRKVEKEVKGFLEQVIKEIGNPDNIVVFGPAEMKKELKKAIEADHKLSGKLHDVVSADSMTDNQVVAWVKEFFK